MLRGAASRTPSPAGSARWRRCRPLATRGPPGQLGSPPGSSLDSTNPFYSLARVLQAVSEGQFAHLGSACSRPEWGGGWTPGLEPPAYWCMQSMLGSQPPLTPGASLLLPCGSPVFRTLPPPLAFRVHLLSALYLESIWEVTGKCTIEDGGCTGQ